MLTEKDFSRTLNFFISEEIKVAKHFHTVYGWFSQLQFLTDEEIAQCFWDSVPGGLGQCLQHHPPQIFNRAYWPAPGYS